MEDFNKYYFKIEGKNHNLEVYEKSSQRRILNITKEFLFDQFISRRLSFKKEAK